MEQKACSRCGGPNDRAPAQRHCAPCHAAYNREYRKTHPLTHRQRWKMIARSYLNVYVRRGKIKRGPCEVCGVTEKIHAHHDDYEKPLAVRWLCEYHHAEHHAHNVNPADMVFPVLRRRT